MPCTAARCKIQQHQRLRSAAAFAQATSAVKSRGKDFTLREGFSARPDVLQVVIGMIGERVHNGVREDLLHVELLKEQGVEHAVVCLGY